jgi:uncharacterized protein (TIGR00369 family)
LIDVSVETSILSRERLVRWADPAALAEAGRTMSGRAFLEAMLHGDLPSPPICHLVGFAIGEIADGQVDVVLTPQESQYNPIGSVHGGVIATVLDSVMGCAVHTRLPAGRGYTTLEIKVNYLRVVTRDTGPMTAAGRVVHLGGRTAMAQASLSDKTGRLYAEASTTCLIFDLPSTTAA